MATLKITIRAEHKEEDRRFLDMQLQKFCETLERAGFRPNLKVDFKPYEKPDPRVGPPQAVPAPAKKKAPAKKG